MNRLPSSARRSQVRAHLARQPGIAIPDLAREYGVSEMTIRRDLAALEQQAHVRRTHGGAVLAERMVTEYSYRARRAVNSAEKRAIALEARKLVEPGQRILLDSGTTTLELATLLKDVKGLTIITANLAIASEMQDARGVDIILLGGVIREGNPDLTGPVTEHSLELFTADIAFQGADGIGPDGSIYNMDLRNARVDRHMRRQAKRCVVLADHTKLGRTALGRNGSLTEVDILITDRAAPAALLKQFKRLGPKIIVVDPLRSPPHDREG